MGSGFSHTDGQGSSSRGSPLEVRQRPTRLAIVLLVIGVSLAASVVLSQIVPGSQARRVPPARAGELVALVGGAVRVDRVTPEQTQPVLPGQFNRAASTTGAGVDAVPPGHRRFSVGVTLVSHAAEGMRYGADRVWLTGTNLRTGGLHRHQLGAGLLPAGEAISGTLIFQVPNEATNLLLNVRDADRPIRLDLPPVEG